MVSLRRHADQRIDDLRARHEAEVAALQAEIDRRVAGVREAVATLERRQAVSEAAIERQRGRTAAYATVGTIIVVAVAVLELILNHTKL